MVQVRRVHSMAGPAACGGVLRGPGGDTAVSRFGQLVYKRGHSATVTRLTHASIDGQIGVQPPRVEEQPSDRSVIPFSN